MSPLYVNRRTLLAGSAGLAGTGLLAACGSPSAGTGASSTPSVSRPPVTAEPGNMSILEWGGYEAAGTKAQTAGMTEAGKSYIEKYGPDSVTYTYITNDDQALQKATSAGPFDLMHPCHENIPDYVSRGLVQPWDTDLLPSFKQLNPYLVKQGAGQGQAVHDPVGLGLRQRSRTAPTTSTRPTRPGGSWPGTRSTRARSRSGAARRRTSRWRRSSSASPKMDNLTDDQLEQAKQDADRAEAAQQVLLGERVRPDAAGHQVRHGLDRLQLAGHPGVDEGRRRSRSSSSNPSQGSACPGSAGSCSARTRRTTTTRTSTSSRSSTRPRARR